MGFAAMTLDELSKSSRRKNAMEVLRSCWLGPEPESNVLKIGLSSMSKSLGAEALLEFPRRPNGSSRLVRQGFFERLLKGQSSLRECAAADVSAAEADVRHLSLKQLLAIRCAHLDLASAASDSKASFISLLDRFTLRALAQRLLPEEGLSDASLALVMRHVVLIYGAHHQLGTRGELGGDWWLVPVHGTRRYLHLPRCELIRSLPPGYVHCYRSHSAPDLKDPRRSRIFRWQILLVSAPDAWTEDATSVEQHSKQHSELRDAEDTLRAEALGTTSFNSDRQMPDQRASLSAFSLFSGDLSELYAQAECELDTMFGDMSFDCSGNDSASLSQKDDSGLNSLSNMANGQQPLVSHQQFARDLRSSKELQDISFDRVDDDLDSILRLDSKPLDAPKLDGSDVPHGANDIDKLFDSLVDELDQFGTSYSVNSTGDGNHERRTTGEQCANDDRNPDALFDSLFDELDHMGPSRSDTPKWCNAVEKLAIAQDQSNGASERGAEDSFDSLFDELDHMGPSTPGADDGSEKAVTVGEQLNGNGMCAKVVSNGCDSHFEAVIEETRVNSSLESLLDEDSPSREDHKSASTLDTFSIRWEFIALALLILSIAMMLGLR